MKKQPILVYLIALIIAGGILYTLHNTEENKFRHATERASEQSVVFLNSFESLCNSSGYTSPINIKLNVGKTATDLSKLPYLIYVYNNGTLSYWNNNLTLPESKLSNIKEEGGLLKLKNGYYLGVRKKVGDLDVVALQLIKNDFTIENRYLQNEFGGNYLFDEAVKVAFPSFPAGQIIKGPNGIELFKVVYEQNPNAKATSSGVIISLITWALLAFLFLWIAYQITKNRGYFPGIICLLLVSVILKITLEWIPFDFLKTNLFSPELYANNNWGKSLGHLLLNSFLIAGIAVYTFIALLKSNLLDKAWVRIVVLLLSALAAFYYSSVIKSLILDSTISFEINNFTILNRYTFVGLGIIVAINLLFFTLQLLVLRASEKSSFILYYLGVAAIVAGLANYLVVGNVMWAIILTMMLLIFYFIQLRYGKNATGYSLYGSFIILLFFTSFQSAGLLEHFNQLKMVNRSLVAATNLSKQRDLIAEYKYNDIHREMLKDPFIKKFLSSPLVSKKELDQRLEYLYFDGYLSKYNVEILAYGKEGNRVRSSAVDSLDDFVEVALVDADSTFSKSLFFVPQSDGNFYYVSILPVEINEQFVGSLVLELTPKTYQKDNLYPELLIEEKNNPIIEDEYSFDYAIYINNKLVSQAGEYPYPFDLDQKLNEGEEYTTYSLFNYKHLLYSDSPKRSVVVSSSQESMLMPISIFSYLFCFFLIIGILVVAFIALFNKYVWKNKDFNLLAISFRNRVNFAMILIIVSSFIIIGFITVRYFSNEYDNYHEQRLIRKQKSVLSALEYTIKENYANWKSASLTALFQNGLSNDIAALSDIHSMDINVFDLSGGLVNSSQPGIFSNGLISSKMEPYAYLTMKQHQVERLVQDESIGSLNYLAIYTPVRDVTGEAIAYLNLPYFAKEENMRTEISEFMVALVNVYVFLLLIAGVIAFLVSNSITSPLAEISKKLRLVNLSEKNEPISWESDDEIGALVKEYNRMISQLEQSAKLLARSERESAWREMARQIAHEIKNPLTPMKLSIQHLQRTINEDPERAQEQAQRVSKTLVEQIENLAQIATAFSSFAKMPKANNEVTDLKEILEGVVALFQEKPTVTLTLKSKLNEAVIFADKNQMISVFNNLVKNAIQATEEVENPKVTVEILPDNDEFMVKIIDNGIGIEEDQKEKVFVPNFTTKSSGTGLGLAISKQIIEQSASGAIWFESEAGKGATFFVVLPAHKQ